MTNHNKMHFHFGKRNTPIAFGFCGQFFHFSFDSSLVELFQKIIGLIEFWNFTIYQNLQSIIKYATVEEK